MVDPDPLQPAYLPRSIGHEETPPGHRFSLYMRAYSRQSGWAVARDGKAAGYESVARVGSGDRRLIEALARRQRSLTSAAGGWIFPAILTAPWSSGLGLAHPLENGFAFLSPYGMPYVAGSGIKGVLRAACRELCNGLFPGPSDVTGDELERFGTLMFGASGDDADSLERAGDVRRRGGLVFLDAIPRLPENAQLRVEVMTPHHGEYLQGGTAPPHENESPNPILFLSVPPGTTLDFCVLPAVCRAPELDDETVGRLLDALFRHAFDWLGFGAKTSVGYGAMRYDDQALEAQRREREAIRSEREREARLAGLPPLERLIEERLEARTDPSEPAHTFLLRELDRGAFASDEAAVAARIRGLMQEAGTWRETPRGKRPEKDKDHQRTLSVLRHLKGEVS